MPIPFSIVLVDDDADDLSLLEECFVSLFPAVQIILVNHPLKMMTALGNAENIRLIVLDMVMPVLTGLECLKLINDSNKYFAIPIVIMTGVMDEPERQQCINSGADGYFLKEVYFENILNTVKGIAREHLSAYDV